MISLVRLPRAQRLLLRRQQAAEQNGPSLRVVWRAFSYRPDFDTSYPYKFINSSTGMAFDLTGWNTAENASIEQYPYNGGANQLLQIALTASSTWFERNGQPGCAQHARSIGE